MTLNFKSRSYWRRLLPVLVIITIIAGCAGFVCHSKPALVPESRPGQLIGYLSSSDLPNSLALVSPPPAAGSAAFALDKYISQRSLALQDTPRWTLAASDADLDFPHAAGTFSCALNAPVTEEDTPHLYMLLRRTLTDFGLSTLAAKKHYNRTRPFVLNKKPLCTTADRAFLETDGSYPSGHSAIGWGWALILAEISPRQIDAILARGRAYGENRNVCNAHWHSDVMQARLVAAGTVAKLHTDPAFRADLKCAKSELAAIRGKGLKLSRDCDAEAAALAAKPSLAP